MSHDLRSTIRAKALETLNGNLPCDKRGPMAWSWKQIEDQGRWLVALWRASGHSELTRKDWAEMLMEGVKPIRSVAEEAQDMAEDEEAVVDFLAFLNTL
jgi:hypothetical protein